MQFNWQSSFFRGVALELWRRVIPPEMTEAEVDFLERTFRADAGSQFLDVPCGAGRHALELARRGYRITGVDSSEESIAQARAASESVQWVLRDMCDLPWESEFSGAYCFGNSFGYLDRRKAARFLAAVARGLKPGARFIVDTGMAAESILPSIGVKRWYRAGDIFMLSENRYHPADGRLDIEYTFIHQGEVDMRPSSSYVFTVAEICRMHQEAGLETVELLASTAGEAYQVGAPRLILVTEKRQPD
ncbi:MAG TPA: class I SAM-dependent methyltransferase [Bryobacteraceae bacterium]|nr:class I SAM-dependent methyltransferase [Bryobacteraceae bacterium]